jgi:hypothetical protein
MSAVEPTKVAVYKDQPVRAYLIGGRVFIDQSDLDAVTGQWWSNEFGFLNPELDGVIQHLRQSKPEFADWLQDEFSELTLIDYSN